MVEESNKSQLTDIPHNIGKPARRVLTNAGYNHLEQLSKISESEILKLHGMGPKALEIIRRALEEKGLSFRD